MASRVAIIAGEASGDTYGGRLASCLRDLVPDIRIQGVGGRRMREAGVDLIEDSSAWGAIGIVESLKVVPRLLLALRRLKRWLQETRPDVLVLIDFGAFNVPLARHAREVGVRSLYFIPPGSWSRNAEYRRLDGLTDFIVTPFPWSAETLTQRGFRAGFYGHPLLDIVHPALSREEFCERCGFDGDLPIVGLLPGSRRQELEHNLPAMVVAAAMLAEGGGRRQFAIPLAQTIDPVPIVRDLSAIPWLDVRASDMEGWAGRGVRVSVGRETARLASERKAAARERVKLSIVRGATADVLSYSRAAVMCSGTVTMEAALLGCPSVIMYRGSRLMELEFKLLGRSIRFIGMPNIILDRAACPELIGSAATPDAVVDAVGKLIPDSPERAAVLADLQEARAILGEPGAMERTAEAVLRLADACASERT